MECLVASSCPEAVPCDNPTIDSLPVRGARSVVDCLSSPYQCGVGLHFSNSRSPVRLVRLLQEELLARVLSLLQPRQLLWVECVNKRMRYSGWCPGLQGSTALLHKLLARLHARVTVLLDACWCCSCHPLFMEGTVQQRVCKI